MMNKAIVKNLTIYGFLMILASARIRYGQAILAEYPNLRFWS